MRLLLLLIIINTIIAVGCLIWGMLKTKENDRCRKTKYILLSVVIFLCPGVGICFFAFSRFGNTSSSYEFQLP